MLLLQADHTGKAALHTQGLHVARIDPGDHRIEQPVHDLLPETPAAELGDRLVRRAPGPPPKQLEQQPQLSFQRERPGVDEGSQAAGKRLQISLPHEVAICRAR